MGWHARASYGSRLLAETEIGLSLTKIFRYLRTFAVAAILWHEAVRIRVRAFVMFVCIGGFEQARALLNLLLFGLGSLN